ncbi:MAG: 2-C-methyl-D-erythritol 2,4-cyclodiphosphate synthase [Candidatus Margulisbacteria bacterium]|nr:2-C-methyl-D-erythritol 2,4-cyclodiphosphate synthase [Candidatus Margulisiibacteriota bacterium]MBU1021628.1 2-C-methyl-D-erythritol 2,4-cyclodiphosphate synthase [Candidatus Margulisiibacteriota bacterium]MBU1728778.1 2-C-methyl-D-erythritol 2,4-cyclodiphosphate synthase [Candidatus Margulisiibacteriota bacterium]MBU1955744.1 2-C-methyl-D-erythritol 2,4-cyclodiphosphate synthase [Candidatus Margulisiibacteriota bacterium]
MRIGFGYDCHALVKGRKLILGGVEIPHSSGLSGHSDADVLTHAIIDAIIGALGEGDIGKHFPDTDPAYKDISSLKLLEEIKKLLNKDQYSIHNIDTTVVLQEPKLAPFVDQIRLNLAKTLGIPANQINIKAKTEEKLGFTGNKQGVKAYAVCLLHQVIK